MTRRIRIAHYVIFDEERGWYWGADDSARSGSNFDIQYIYLHAAKAPSYASSSGRAEPVSTGHVTRGTSPATPPSPVSAPATPEFVTTPAHDDRLDAAHRDTPVRYRMV